MLALAGILSRTKRMNEHDPSASPPASAPQGQAGMDMFEYMGFWKRVLASIIDNVIAAAILFPVGVLVVRMDADKGSAEWIGDILQTLILAAAIILLWTYVGSTPGKMVFGAKVVDEATFRNPSLGKSILRYVGYIPSIVLFFGGFIMVAFDKKKRGLHDLIAGTLVVVPKSR